MTAKRSKKSSFSFARLLKCCFNQMKAETKKIFFGVENNGCPMVGESNIKVLSMTTHFLGQDSVESDLEARREVQHAPGCFLKGKEIFKIFMKITLWFYEMSAQQSIPFSISYTWGLSPKIICELN